MSDIAQKTKILKLFKKEAIQFLDELIEQFPKEGSLVVGKIFLENQMPIETIMQSFCEKIIPHSDMVKTRNEKFFLDYDVSFFEINPEDVTQFKNLWQQLDPDAKYTVWEWFDLFINLGQKYLVECSKNN